MGARTERPLRAYVLKVAGDYEERARVVFAPTRRDALRYAVDDETYIDRRAKHMPEFDEFAPGPVPVPVLLAHGWYQSCGWCESAIHEGAEGAVITDREAYCSVECEARSAGMLAGYAFRDAELAAARAEAARRWPEAGEPVYATWNHSCYRQPLPAEFRISVRLAWGHHPDVRYGTWTEGDRDVAMDAEGPR